MTLLTSMLERPLDAGYQEAADRRSAAGLAASTSTRSVIVVVMAVLTGFLFAVGAQALRPKPTAAAAAKSQLVQRIESLQTLSATQEAKITALGKEVRGYEALALQQAGGADLTDAIKRLEVQAGAVPLKGPGLTMTLDDAPNPGGAADAGHRPSGGFESGRVTSADLQIVVNGLWGAGAEAISINGHRLTSTAAIRFAGQAIIVDFRPLARPYVITALGDASGMQQIFEPSFAGVYLSQLTHEFGIRSTIARSDSLTVPGDSAARLTVARPIGTRDRTATSSGSPTRSGTPSKTSPTPSGSDRTAGASGASTDRVAP
jgi:uncharacterized protein YlxW (UPF0749 family)